MKGNWYKSNFSQIVKADKKTEDIHVDILGLIFSKKAKNLAICFERGLELFGDLFWVTAFDLVAVEDPHHFTVFE